MTGWRVGFVHGPAHLVADVLKVHDALVTCAPVVSQYAALAALELGDAGHRRLPRGVPPPPRPGHRAARRPAARLRLPEAERVLLRVPARQGHGAAGARLAPARRGHPRAGPRGARPGRRLRARPARRTCASATRGSADDVHRAFDRLDDYFAGRPGAHDARCRPRPARPRRRRGLGAPCGRGAAAARRPGAPGAHGGRASSPSRGRRARPSIKRIGRRAARGRPAPRAVPIPLSYNTADRPAARHPRRESTRAARLALLAGWRRRCGRPTGRGRRRTSWSSSWGCERPGDMRAHLELVRPDIAVVTPLAPSFSEDAGALADPAPGDRWCSADGGPASAAAAVYGRSVPRRAGRSDARRRRASPATTSWTGRRGSSCASGAPPGRRARCGRRQPPAGPLCGRPGRAPARGRRRGHRRVPGRLDSSAPRRTASSLTRGVRAQYLRPHTTNGIDRGDAMALDSTKNLAASPRSTPARTRRTSSRSR